MPDDTRDLAIRAMQKIESHIDACERRYNEGNQRQERLFAFIKEAHEENKKEIGATKIQIGAIATIISEQQGAAKFGKLLGNVVAGLGGAGVVATAIKILHL